jgi:hypothetical protein
MYQVPCTVLCNGFHYYGFWYISVLRNNRWPEVTADNARRHVDRQEASILGANFLFPSEKLAPKNDASCLSTCIIGSIFSVRSSNYRTPNGGSALELRLQAAQSELKYDRERPYGQQSVR